MTPAYLIQALAAIADGEGDAQVIAQQALARWEERELGFPARVRRMVPDELDCATGAWQRCAGEMLNVSATRVADIGAAQGVPRTQTPTKGELK
jgi:hypothetical protein